MLPTKGPTSRLEQEPAGTFNYRRRSASGDDVNDRFAPGALKYNTTQVDEAKYSRYLELKEKQRAIEAEAQQIRDGSLGREPYPQAELAPVSLTNQSGTVPNSSLKYGNAAYYA